MRAKLTNQDVQRSLQTLESIETSGLTQRTSFSVTRVVEMKYSTFVKAPAQRRADGNASLAACIANLAKTILGAGILTLPGAFKGAGLAWGIVFTVVAAITCMFSLALLGELVSIEGARPSLASIGERAAGTAGKRFVDLVLVTNNTGAMVSYLVIASTTMSDLVGSVLSRHTFVILGVLLVSPLCLVREVATLRFSSSIALCAVFVLISMIALFAVPGLFEPCGSGDGDACRGEVHLTADSASVLTQFVLFTNAYTCQQGAVPVLAELSNPTRSRKFLVALGTISVVFPLFLLVSIAGYTTFGSKVDSDVLLNYPSGAFVTSARVGIVIDVMTSYPLMIFFTRNSTANLLEACCGMAAAEQESAPEIRADGSNLFISNRLDRLATAVLVGVSTSISLLVSDLGVVAALTGAVGATSLGYILPGFLYWRLSTSQGGASIRADQPLIHEGTPDLEGGLLSSSVMAYGALALLALGVFLLPAGIALTLMEQRQ